MLQLASSPTWDFQASCYFVADSISWCVASWKFLVVQASPPPSCCWLRSQSHSHREMWAKGIAFWGWFWPAHTVSQSLTMSWKRSLTGERPGHAQHMGMSLPIPQILPPLFSKPSSYSTIQKEAGPARHQAWQLWRFLSCCFLLFIQWSVGCFQINPLNKKFWECTTLKMRTDNSLLVGYIIKHVVAALKKKKKKSRCVSIAHMLNSGIFIPFPSCCQLVKKLISALISVVNQSLC